MKDGGWGAVALPLWHRLLLGKLSWPLNQRVTSTKTTALVQPGLSTGSW